MVDGDKSLVVADKTIIDVAERNIEKYDIVPLYYEMKKAIPSVLNNENIYNSLILAFTSAPIGVFSNNISKIWCNEVFINGTDEEQQKALECIKRLCCQNNMIIDYAKTLYKPEFPKDIQREIQCFTKLKLPYFFKYAKDKLEYQVADINNCLVNNFLSHISSPRISCKYIKDNGQYGRLEKPNYKLLMTNPDINVDIVVSDTGRLIQGTNPVVLKYIEKAKEYWKKINATSTQNMQNCPRNALTKTQVRQQYLYNQTVKEVKQELSTFGYSDVEIADILVKYLYGIKESKYKDLLWTCYGEYLYANLLKYRKQYLKEVQCIDCGEWFTVSIRDTKTCRCSRCNQDRKREQTKLRVQKYRQK